VRLPDPPLLLVTDRRQARRALADIVAQACAAGCRWVSLREKDLPPSEQIALARALRTVMQPYGACLTVHGDAALARAAGVDGVHLPAGADVGAARAVLGADALIGLSIHSAAEAAAAGGVVDYVVAGPAYETASKPGYGPALGPAGIAALTRAAPVALVAIGGLTRDNLADLIAAGAAGVAVMGSIMRAADPIEETKALLAALAHAKAA
jgi:thiamine-phosphate pyrophosphorylase